MLETGDYEIVQLKGQRILSMKQWEGPTPSKDCEVFVGKIPFDCFEDELLQIFTRIGDVFEIRLMITFKGHHKLYGFVKYANSNLVDIAIKELNNFEVRPGQHIGVVRAVNNCRLHIGGLPETLSTFDVKEVVTKLTEGVFSIKTGSNPNPSRQGYGLYAIIEYADHRQTALALKALTLANTQMWGEWVTVQWASSLENNEEFHNQVNDGPMKAFSWKMQNVKMNIDSDRVGNLTVAASQPLQIICDHFNPRVNHYWNLCLPHNMPERQLYCPSVPPGKESAWAQIVRNYTYIAHIQQSKRQLWNSSQQPLCYCAFRRSPARSDNFLDPKNEETFAASTKL